MWERCEELALDLLEDEGCHWLHRCAWKLFLACSNIQDALLLRVMRAGSMRVLREQQMRAKPDELAACKTLASSSGAQSKPHGGAMSLEACTRLLKAFFKRVEPSDSERLSRVKLTIYERGDAPPLVHAARGLAPRARRAGRRVNEAAS